MEEMRRIKDGWWNVVLDKPIKGQEDINIQCIVEESGIYVVFSIEPLIITDIENINLENYNFKNTKDLTEDKEVKPMNELQIFSNPKFGDIRTVSINNEVYFVAKDVCDALELSNPTMAVNRLDEDERTKLNLGRQGSTNFVNEYGLYNLVLASRKKEAREFKRWITHDVLPVIRKHGAYMTPAKIEEVLLNPDTIIQLATELKKEREEKEKLSIINDQQNQLIGELKPKADYTDKILSSKGTVKINTIANDYGLTAQAMNKKLHSLGVQYKQGKDWLLYRQHRGKGYTHSKTIHFYRNDGTPDTNINMEWTQKGRLFIYEC